MHTVNSQSMAKPSLFPENEKTRPGQPGDIFGSPSHIASDNGSETQPSAGSNDSFHSLTDKQIAKLVALRFHNDPNLLIRLLLKDLSAKETELILLRKEKFQREQELYRMCTEYGNLSTLEIDKRLNALQKEPDVHKILSEMIGSAVNEDPRSDLVPKRIGRAKAHSDSYQRQRRRDMRAGSRHGESTTAADARAGLEAPAKDKRVLHWLDWFNPSDELLPSSSSTSLNKIRAMGSKSLSSNSPVKAPVELGSIGSPLDDDTSSIDSTTDKYGFYNDAFAKPILPAEPQTHVSDDHPMLPEGLKSPDWLRSPILPNSPDSTAFPEPSVTRSTVIVSAADANPGEILATIDRLKQLGERHDAENEILVKKWENFMKTISKEKFKHSGQDTAYEIFGVKASNLKRSDKLLSKFFVTEDDRGEETRLYKALQALIGEGGIPTKYRNQLWFELSGAKNREVPGEYQRLVELSRRATDPLILKHKEEIDLDLHRTLPSNKFFNDVAKNQPGPQFYKLQNILYAFVTYKPDLGYSQGMNKVVGSILLGANEGNNSGGVKLKEEDIFWIFVSLTEDILPSYNDMNFFHPKAVPLIQQDVSLVATTYFAQTMPTLHLHLQKLDVDIQVPLLGWWLGVFTENVVSVELWLKMLDSLLVAEYGDVRFMAYSLALIKVCERPLLEATDADQVFNVLYHLKQNQVYLANVRFADLSALTAEFQKQIAYPGLEEQRKKLRR